MTEPLHSKTYWPILPWFGLLVLLAGCHSGPQRGVLWAEYDGHSWTDDSGSGVPGIDAGSVTVVTLRTDPDHEMSVVFWSDLPADRAGHSGLAGPVMVGGGVSGARYAGGHADTDGRKVGFKAHTLDGQTATLTIGQTTYSSDNGKFFLISSQGGTPVVKQLEIDPFTGSNKDAFYTEFAHSNEVVRDFFADPSKGENNDRSSTE